jgi:hypothetical protein
VGIVESLLGQEFSEDGPSHLPTRKGFEACGRPLVLLLTGRDGKSAFCFFLRTQVIPDGAVFWSYMQIYDGIMKLIEGLDPGIVVVDSLLNTGLNACYSLNRKSVVNNPGTLIDIARMRQAKP